MVASIPLVFDWTRFSGGEAGIPFQRMAIALFANVHGTAGLTFGPTHTSRDGGNDAWYDGEIEGVRARWKIACAVRKDLRTLLDKARDEHDDGLGAGAEAILLCTPLDLNVDQVRAVEAVLGGGEPPPRLIFSAGGAAEKPDLVRISPGHA
jgi:hypothetical protein